MFEVTQVRTAALGARIAHQLRFQIVSGKIDSGAHLAEERLAESFGVSRGPIRDALRQLASEGLVETRRGRVYAIGLNDQDIDELYSLRESLESLAVRSTLSRERVDWSHFERSIERMRDAADRQAAGDFAEADLAFHSLFYEWSGHRRLASMWRELRPTFTVLLEVTTAEDVDLHPSAESHADILRSMRFGEIDAALGELSQHLLGAKNRLTTAHERVRREAGQRRSD